MIVVFTYSMYNKMSEWKLKGFLPLKVPHHFCQVLFAKQFSKSILDSKGDEFLLYLSTERTANNLNNLDPSLINNTVK